MIATELHRFSTADHETLHGLMFRPASANPSPLALVMVHGVAMNFYSGPLPVFGQALAARGYDIFCANNRGHDWIVRSGDLTAFGGATYERFEDCLLDLDGALEWLRQKGYERFVLVGHSLGAVKVVYYQGNRRRSDVLGIVSCSAPKQFYAARALAQEDFSERMTDAEKRLTEGRGEELLWAPASGATGLFSARTYVNKYGRQETTDVRPHATRIACPLLALAGEAEASTFREYAAELATAAGERNEGRYVLIPAANHFYRGCEALVIDTLDEWLTERLEK